MKPTAILIFILLFISCDRQSDKLQALQKRMDSLEIRLSKTYKPGFGELMTGVQAHHSKLWFAGQNENWELAAFEIKEIKEILDDILFFQKERVETKLIGMINPGIDSVAQAVRNKNKRSFTDSYQYLTHSCNDCHKLTNFKYNIVKVPDTSPFTNQDFRIK